MQAEEGKLVRTSAKEFSDAIMRAVRPSFVLASMSTCVARLLAQSISDRHATLHKITKLRPECQDGYLTGQVTG